MDNNIRAVLRNSRITPRKSRLVLRGIRGKNSLEALQTLRFSPLKASSIIHGVLKSAVSNAKKQYGINNAENLIIKGAYAGDGVKLKRHYCGSRGSAKQFLRRSSHITILLEEKK